MGVRSYRVLRLVVGGGVLVASLAIFADVADWFGSPVTDAVTWAQFLPSALSLLGGAGWVAVGCLAVLVLTLLFGRVYCAMLCPLGVFMDLSAWLAKKRGNRRGLPHRKGRPWVRLGILAAAVALAASGTMAVLGFLDPFSLFGRMTAHLVRPLGGMVHRQAALAGLADPTPLSPSPWPAALAAIALLALIAWLAVARGRLWCNTVCPVGTILGFFSRFALFRLRMAPGPCTACSLCERTCPAQCVDYHNHRIDHSRCIMCLQCVTACRKSGISLQRTWRLPHPRHREALPPTPPVSRRGFLASTALLASGHEGHHRRGHGGGGGGSERCQTVVKAAMRPVLPPGARSVERFRATCTACQLCVANCPEQVLRPAITEGGWQGFLQPILDFDHAFCSITCNNCSQVCPTGAIQSISLEERRTVQTGIVEFVRGRCVVKTEGTPCGACAEHCPTAAVRMVPFRDGLTIPEVEPDLCIGCGACEYICPVRPEKAILVDGLPVHATSTPVDTSGANTVRPIEEEFPF